MARLVLFDIDGTLLDCGGQSKPLFSAAMIEVFGTTGAVETYDFSGRTDPRIVVDLATGAGISPDAVVAGLPRVQTSYLDRLERHLDRERVRVLPGVVDLLDRLRADEGTLVGLITGNWERGAAIKLGRHGLWERFPFGAFGDDQIDRRDLPPVALARAGELTGHGFHPEEVLIVGDTRLDVECARAHGIPCLAVASGWTAAEHLAEAGADWVVPSLAARDLAATPLASPPIRVDG